MSLRMDAGFEHLKEAIADALARVVEFPPGVFVTVLGTKVTANTAHAKVVLSVFPNDAGKSALEALESYQREIKEELSRTLRLRRMPRIHYTFDPTEAVAEGVEETLNRLKSAGEI